MENFVFSASISDLFLIKTLEYIVHTYLHWQQIQFDRDFKNQKYVWKTYCPFKK